jgi:gluconate 2-dehydrogenase gamma chain
MTRKTIARREALERLALGSLGIAAVPGWVSALATRALNQAHTTARQPAAAAWTPHALTAHQVETVATIAELIIPRTDTAGARDARVHEFIDAVLADGEAAERNKFLNGLSWIDERSHSRYGVDFIKASPEQQAQLLTPLSRPVEKKPLADKESAYETTRPLQQDPPDAPPVARDFFTAIKSLTITGYYTSEAGMREELNDDGSVFFADYEGCSHPSHGFERAR